MWKMHFVQMLFIRTLYAYAKHKIKFIFTIFEISTVCGFISVKNIFDSK